MPDFVTENGELRESKELIRKKVGTYLEAYGEHVPILKSRDTALGRALLAKKSVCITYETLAQVHAHIRAALWQYVHAHYNRGDWRLDYLQVDSSSLISAYLGSERLAFSSARLVTVPLLIIEAPVWQRTKASKDHAATLFMQRLGSRRPTWIYSHDFHVFTTGCADNLRAHSPDFNKVLLDHPDFEHITLVADQFEDEVRDWNGYTL